MAHTSVTSAVAHFDGIFFKCHLFICLIENGRSSQPFVDVYSMHMRRSVAVGRTQWRIVSRFASFLSLSNYRITFWDLNWEGRVSVCACECIADCRGGFTIAVHPPTHVILSRKRWGLSALVSCTFQHIAIARMRAAATAMAHIWMKPIRKWRGRFAEIRFASMIFKGQH